MHCRVGDVMDNLGKLLRTSNNPNLSRLRVVHEVEDTEAGATNPLTFPTFVIKSMNRPIDTFEITLNPNWVFTIRYTPSSNIPPKYCHAFVHHALFVHSTFKTSQYVYINVSERRLQWEISCDHVDGLAELLAVIPNDVEAFAAAEEADFSLSKTIPTEIISAKDPRFVSFNAGSEALHPGISDRITHFASDLHHFTITLLPQTKISIEYQQRFVDPTEAQALIKGGSIPHALHFDLSTIVRKQFKTGEYAKVDPIDLIIVWVSSWTGVAHLLDVCSDILRDVALLRADGFSPPGTVRTRPSSWTPAIWRKELRAKEQAQIPNSSPCAMMSRAVVRLRLLKSIVSSLRAQSLDGVASKELDELIHDIDKADVEHGSRPIEARVQGMLAQYARELASNTGIGFATQAMRLARVFLVDVRDSALRWFLRSRMAHVHIPIVRQMATTVRGLLRVKSRVRVSCSEFRIDIGGMASGAVVPQEICEELGEFMIGNQDCLIFMSTLDSGAPEGHANLLVVEKGAGNVVDITRYDPHGTHSTSIGAVQRATVKLFEACNIVVGRYELPNTSLMMGMDGVEYTVNRPASQNEEAVRALLPALFAGIHDAGAFKGLCVAYCALMMVQIMAAFATSVDKFSVARLVQEVAILVPNPLHILGVIELLYKVHSTGCPQFGPSAANLDGSDPNRGRATEWNYWNKNKTLGPIVHEGDGERGRKRRVDMFDQSSSPSSWSQQALLQHPSKLIKRGTGRTDDVQGA